MISSIPKATARCKCKNTNQSHLLGCHGLKSTCNPRNATHRHLAKHVHFTGWTPQAPRFHQVFQGQTNILRGWQENELGAARLEMRCQQNHGIFKAEIFMSQVTSTFPNSKVKSFSTRLVLVASHKVVNVSEVEILSVSLLDGHTEVYRMPNLAVLQRQTIPDTFCPNKTLRWCNHHWERSLFMNHYEYDGYYNQYYGGSQLINLSSYINLSTFNHGLIMFKTTHENSSFFSKKWTCPSLPRPRVVTFDGEVIAPNGNMSAGTRVSTSRLSHMTDQHWDYWLSIKTADCQFCS